MQDISGPDITTITVMSVPREALDLKIGDIIDRPNWFAKIKKCQRNLFTVIKTFITKPLFSRYSFSRFIVRTLLHKINFTRGVHRVVSFNGTPVPIDYDVIAFFKSLIDKNGFLHIGESLKAQLMSSIFSSRPDQYSWTSFIIYSVTDRYRAEERWRRLHPLATKIYA